jgi:plasmid stabilization system protein ParE
MIYRFLSPAVDEIREAATFYQTRVRGLGADFISEVDSAIERILAYPEAWSKLAKNYRHCSLRRFPFSVIYQIIDDREILIVSVFHQSREPESWRRNVES